MKPTNLTLIPPSSDKNKEFMLEMLEALKEEVLEDGVSEMVLCWVGQDAAIKSAACCNKFTGAVGLLETIKVGMIARNNEEGF